VTVPSASSTSDCSPLSAQEVWPQENEIDLSLALLTQLKIMAMSVDLSTLPLDGIYYKNEDELNPALSNKSINLGVLKEILFLD
jgi:hypothetical protein